MKKALDPKQMERLQRKMDRVAENIEIATIEELKRGAENITSLAKMLCPVGETGNLQRSIRWEWGQADMQAVIGTNVEYAPHVEFGTQTRAAQPFLFPAYKHEEPIFRQTLEHRINAEMKKVAK